MKEATGDMTMTIVVIVGIVAVLTLGSTVIWPAIRDKIINNTNKITEPDLTKINPGNGTSYYIEQENIFYI